MEFRQIKITITLSPEMDADMPKDGPGEMTAIDKHSEAIDRVIVEPLEMIQNDLAALGYKVEIDDD